MNIILYYKTGCPWATEVMDFLKENDLPFEDRNITVDPEFLREVQEKSGHSKSPTLDVDGKILSDTDAGQVAEYLESIGVLA